MEDSDLDEIRARRLAQLQGQYGVRISVEKDPDPVPLVRLYCPCQHASLKCNAWPFLSLMANMTGRSP